ncbi:hypothetical protein HMPREF0542_12237 [Ligilactobacillus ruminis ATCC 25644]|uniref:Uncharacterized protein n=1 Tax=Ligilactobacillus ruminis ATCC 25644 TaxID=525362 RepID=E7FTK9_9LACO|nr:hypothetical protein HMPREF0542_12237 [Ligilactobacillus ruminis ATCC 25644]
MFLSMHGCKSRFRSFCMLKNAGLRFTASETKQIFPCVARQSSKTKRH